MPSNRMSHAPRARDSYLDAARIRILRALRPGHPYSTHLPSVNGPSGEVTTVRHDPGPHRARLSWAAFFLASTGRSFNRILPVFVLG